MTRLFLLLFVLLTHISGIGQSEKHREDNFLLFRKEVKDFIGMATSESTGKGKYNLYTVDLYNAGSDTDAFCFSITFITNPDQYVYLKEQCFFTIDNDMILVQGVDRPVRSWLNKKEIKYVDNENKKEFYKKLFPTSEGVIVADETITMLCWYDGRQVRRAFYEDTSEIPKNFSISKFPKDRKREGNMQKTFPAPDFSK